MDNTTDAKTPNTSAATEPESIKASKPNLPTSSAMTKDIKNDGNNQSSSLPENSASGKCKSDASAVIPTSTAKSSKSSLVPDGQQANVDKTKIEKTVSSQNAFKSPGAAHLQKTTENSQDKLAGPQNNQDKQKAADMDKSSQNCSKVPEPAKSPEKSKLKASPQKKAQQQGKLKKRRHSNQPQQGDGGPPKKKKAKGSRRSDPNFRMLPNQFLDGGILLFYVFDYFNFPVVFFTF